MQRVAPPARLICASLLLALAAPAAAEPLVLVFSKTTGFRHASIDDGIALLQKLGSQQGFAVETSEDGAAFSAANLARFDAVIWLSTTGDVLDDAQQQVFRDWLEAGGGYVGVHAAADCEYSWPWYGTAMLGNGAWFESHPTIQAATLIRESGDDPSTAHLPEQFDFTDEWYNFRENPRPGATVLLRLDESTYKPGDGAMGDDHPISWKREVGLGRAWYTGLGHRPETYADARFVGHLAGGVDWVLDDATVFADGFESAPASGVR